MKHNRSHPTLSLPLSLVFALILAGLLLVPSAAKAGFFDDFRADAFTSVSTITDSVTGGLTSFFTNLKDALKRESEKTSPNNPQTSPKEEPKKQNEKQKQGTPALVSPAPSDLEARIPSKIPSQPTITPTPFRGRSPDQRVGVERTVERVVRVPVLPPPTPVPASSILDTVNDKLSQLENKLKAEIYRVASNASSQSNALSRVVSLTNKIDNLSNVTISNATLSGSVSGLTDDHVPDTITASNYLPLSGGTLTGALVGTSATTTNFFSTTASSTNLFATSLAVGGATLGNTTIGGTLSVSGLASLSGAASTTRLSIFDTAYFGGTATTTVSQTAVNLPTGGTYQINSANVLSNNTLGAGVLSSSLTSLGTLSSLAVSGLSSLSNASSTQLSIFNNAYFGATATSSFSSTGALTLITPLLVGSGGTGLTSYTAGDVLYASGTGTLAGTSTPNLKSTLALNLVENTALSTWAGGTALTTLGTISTGVWSGTSIADAKIDDNITLTNITQITNRAISDTSGTLTVARGGTGQTSFGQGWLHSDGTTFTSSTSPTVNYLTATSTTATSTFAAGIQTTALNITGTSATSTFARGIELAAGCFSINGTCVGGASGTQGQLSFYNTTGTTLTATSTLTLTQAGLFGLGTSTPYSKLSVWGGGTGTGQLFELTNSASTTIAKFLDNGTAYILGNLGIGTTSPYRKLSITDTVSAAQAVIAYDSSRYTELQTNSVGDFIITTQGNDALLNNDNLWVCTGGSCPSGTPTGQGNLIVENRLGIGTSSPYATLSVVGETVSTYFTATSATATSTFAGGLKLNKAGTGIEFQDGTIQTTAAAAIPAGVISLYGGTVAPTGWLLCDGAAVSRTTYAALFTAIGTSFGAGDGSTTFNVPDGRGRAPIGAGQGSGLTNRALAGTGGAETHTLSTSEIPSHTHSLTVMDNSSSLGTNPARGVDGGAVLNTNTTGGGGAHNNMQPFLVLTFIIKI